MRDPDDEFILELAVECDADVVMRESLAKKASELARKDEISIDQFASLAIAEKMSAWLTRDYLAARSLQAGTDFSEL